MIRSLRFTTIILLGVACTDVPNQPTAAVNLAHKPGHGGGPPVTDFPITMAGFTGNLSVSTAPIIDGQDFADARVKANGQLWTDTYVGNPNRGDPVTHRMCFDLSSPQTVFAGAELAEFTSVIGNDLANACGWGLIHSRDHSNGGDRMLSQAEGSVEHAGGKFVFKEFDSKKGSWDWRILFDSPQTQNLPDHGEGLCIDRVDADNWTLSNGCVADNGTVVDDVVGLWKFPGPIRVADFVAPLSFTVAR